MSEHSGSEHSGSSERHGRHSHHHHHRKRKDRDIKKLLIVLAAVVGIIGIFALLVLGLDWLDTRKLHLLSESDTNVSETSDPDNAAAKKTISLSAAPQTVNWCALGDSITYGSYSTVSPDGSVSVSVSDRENIAWPFLMAKTNGWSLTNLAAGNEGYLTPSGDESGLPGYAKARSMDFTPYNLVTISLGINDWINNFPMGTMEDDPQDETIKSFIPAMRATIESVARSNPHCKIIVILPLNAKGYNQTYGTQDTNWAMGYEMSHSGTLKQFTEAMKAVCDYYGVEYIDMTSRSCINSISLPDMLPDGIHPSVEAHSLLAHELSAKILFK